MSDPGRVLHKGWTERHLREALELASPQALDILHHIALHPGCTSPEIARALGLKSKRSVGQLLRQGFTNRTEHLGVVDPVDGQYHWPLEFPGKRGDHELYDMHPAVRAVVLDTLGQG